MNPVLLKPESETGAQVIVQGKRWATLKAREYGERKSELLPAVLGELWPTGGDSDLVLVEGAGSPAEINLRARRHRQYGLCRGGRRAGGPRRRHRPRRRDRGARRHARACSMPEERERDQGLHHQPLPRRSVALRRGARARSARRTGWRVARHRAAFCRARRGCRRRTCSGFPTAERQTAQRDPDRRAAACRASPISTTSIRCGPSRTSTCSSSSPGKRFPAIATWSSCPGSKSTIADLEALRREGWDIDIARASPARRRACSASAAATRCSGEAIADPGRRRRDGGNGRRARAARGGRRCSAADKTTRAGGRPARRKRRGGVRLRNPSRPKRRRRIARGRSSRSRGRPDGAVSADGLVAGTYVHGLFASDGFRRAFLAKLGGRASANLRSRRRGRARRARRASRSASRPRRDPRYRASERAIAAASADQDQRAAPRQRRSAGSPHAMSSGAALAPPAGIEPGAVDRHRRRSGAARRGRGRARRRARPPASRRSAICASARRAERRRSAAGIAARDQRRGATISSAESRAGNEIQEVVEPRRRPAERLMPRRAVADHGIGGVHAPCRRGGPGGRAADTRRPGATTPSEKFSAAEFDRGPRDARFVEHRNVAADDLAPPRAAAPTARRSERPRHGRDMVDEALLREKDRDNESPRSTMPKGMTETSRWSDGAEDRRRRQ